MPTAPRTESMLAALRLAAPGTMLREGIQHVLQAHMGALIVIGAGPEVLSVCSGGFLLDAEFTPQRLYELAKMDGAIIVTADCARLVRANVHLVPDPNIPTSETGTRHRTAERVARQISCRSITISEDRSEVAIHIGGLKRTLEPTPRVLARADQALQILERYKTRLDGVSGSLSALEVEDLVTVRDVATVLQRAEMVRRISEEIEGYVIELGADGRFVMLQLDELIGGVDDDRRLVAKDYYQSTPDWELDRRHGRPRRPRRRVAARPGGGRVRPAPPARRSGSTARSSPRATGCCTRSRGSPRSSPTTSSPDSRACRRSCGPASPTSSRSRVSATPAPAPIKDGLARLAETSILERYV